MSRVEELKTYCEQMASLKKDVMTAHNAYKNHEALFMAWISKECAITQDEKDVPLCDILLKWSVNEK